MKEWEITDQEIKLTEKLLLPEGAHFSEDAKNVLRCWHSTDVAACPGSGKTTVLLAKLKLLADRMPFANGAGICVLSHTNVAVDEIKKRLSSYADKLLRYPNYIGTIQSFIDKFVTMPYLRNIAGQRVQAVDDFTYAQYVVNQMQKHRKYNSLNFMIETKLKTSTQFKTKIEYVQRLYIGNDGALYMEKQKRALAGSDKESTKRYKEILDNLLKKEGIIRYKDAYAYAKAAVDDLSETYTDLFSARFKYIFIDEYQDCDEIQRQAMDAIFNSTRCTVMKIGDSDQAIYNSSQDRTPDWIPQVGFLPIMTSNRYSQEIADVICNLKKDKTNIITSVGKTGIKPVLLVFDTESIGKVIGGYISVLEKKELFDENGIYKVIGAVKKESLAGLKVGDYWSEFDASAKKQEEYNYWILLDGIIVNLLEGKLYKAEGIVRKLLCRIFHYTEITNSESGKEFSVVTIKKFLDSEYKDEYRQWISELSKVRPIDRKTIDCLMRQRINELFKMNGLESDDVFKKLPNYFLDGDVIVDQDKKIEKNVFIDPLRGRRIKFDTVHGVKGETHDATLYLETEQNGASDLSRILPYYGIGKVKASNLYDYSRKLAYVGMSRPKKLLCVAMKGETYEKGEKVFVGDWEIIDLRT
ncbi:UvrD-helicase domain-containing protein [Anthropogastromicrobium aceti]|uniref:UvrD-helicase domain-containing protein n=1 Tax=Anthropogastromicrobium aceti TaxID=2981768 RepID=A0AAE3E1Y0_9FIRM|nr:UvrD-helicase domain-containing protein [Anthropogastromicrobium aceti]MCC2220559.1 UvrD-helicase domain-containing protein [Anthropogastromicrobium aceti]